MGRHRVQWEDNIRDRVYSRGHIAEADKDKEMSTEDTEIRGRDNEVKMEKEKEMYHNTYVSFLKRHSTLSTRFDSTFHLGDLVHP